MATDRIHEMLPWYVNGTLDLEERVAFERHLAECETCRNELKVLEELRAELERHGEAFLSDHPAPETLVALVRSAEGQSEDVRSQEPLSDEEAVAMRHHLMICATCAEEARWVRGEATASTGGNGPKAARHDLPRSRRTWLWVGTAAAALLALVFVVVVQESPVWFGPDARTGLMPPPAFIESTQRAGEGRREVRVAPGETVFRLVLEVDRDADSFPLSLDIHQAHGGPGHGERQVLREQSISPDDLFQDRFLFLMCRRKDFPDGDYLARLSGRKAGETPIDYPFRVLTSRGPRTPS